MAFDRRRGALGHTSAKLVGRVIASKLYLSNSDTSDVCSEMVVLSFFRDRITHNFLNKYGGRN